MSNFQYSASLVVVSLIYGAMTVTAQTNARDQTNVSTITTGLSLEQAVSILDRNGYNKPYGLAWPKPAPDRSIHSLQIDEGVVLALTYSDSTQSILTIQMLFISPVLAKANDRIVGLRRISFESDGTYILHVLKQEKPQAETPASPTPTLPRQKKGQ